MADKVAKALKRAHGSTVEQFAHKALVWWLPILYCLISSLFYLRTYDSAQVKITVMQMGGLALLTMWACRLVEMGRNALNKDDLVALSPFLAYLAVGVVSFLHAPYHMASVDFFLRHCFFMIAALVVIYEFEGEAIERLTSVLIFTAWVAVLYGILQFVDNAYFPRGIGKGIDPFIWRGAFGERVFSTYGNPNFFADFLVITFPIILMQWFRTRSVSHLVLMALLLVDLYKTGTKGAWLGFAMVAFLFGVIAFVYFPKRIERFKFKILGLVVMVVGGFLAIVAKDISARMVSVNFRLFTWEATWEMIQTQPILGNGIGSFPPIYPAFRRPPIFHIEGKHNTETDHSENEYIEQLFDNGILGFGIFLWLIFSTLSLGFKTLGHLTSPVASDKDGNPPGRAYSIIGYMVALMGMLGHNFFDVSMRFVSSGVYLGLLSGVIVALSRGQSLYERHAAAKEAAVAPEGEKGPWAAVSEFLIWPARLAAFSALLYLCFGMDWGELQKQAMQMRGSIPSGGIVGEFALLQGGFDRMQYMGERLQWWLSWGVFLGCILSVGYILIRLAYLAENPLVPALVVAMCWPMYIFWGYFKADIHHNIAIFFSKERRWDEALHHYFKVRQLNPNFVMSVYFMGNVYNDRLDMNRVDNPRWGDARGQARDDYERAIDAYNEVRKLAPNYVQMHHQVGNLHLKRAEYAMSQGRKDEAEVYLDRAMIRYRLYQAIDPVFPQNYYRIAQIYMIRKDYTAAMKTYEELIDAPQCAVDPALLKIPWLRNTILSYQTYVETPEGWRHKHESGESYASLANAYYLLERWEDAEAAYLKALTLDPNQGNAKANLQVLYNRMMQQGRLRKLPPPPPGKALTRPFTGYEIIPRKK
jgi:O-antigen ligase/tetratricopeptide (TPR) repeat protein